MKTLPGLEPNEWIFLIISVINVLVALALAIERLATLEKHVPEHSFTIIVIINIGKMKLGKEY